MNQTENKQDFKQGIALLISGAERTKAIVSGLIEYGKLDMLASPPGAGKTMIALEISRAIITGTRAFGDRGFPTTKGIVIYIDAENGEQELSRRMNAYFSIKQSNTAIETEEERNKMYSYMKDALAQAGVNLEDLQNFYYQSLQGMRLNDEQKTLIKAITKLIDDIKTRSELPILVIIDTLRSNMDGNENESQVISDALLPLKEMAARKQSVSVLVLHHVVKKKARKDGTTTPLTITDLRGSSDIAGKVDVAFGMWQEIEEQDEDSELIDFDKSTMKFVGRRQQSASIIFKTLKGRSGGLLSEFILRVYNDKDTGRLVVRFIGSIAQINSEMVNIANVVMDYFNSNGNKESQTDKILEYAKSKGRNVNTTKKVIQILKDGKYLENVKYGVYRLSENILPELHKSS